MRITAILAPLLLVTVSACGGEVGPRGEMGERGERGEMGERGERGEMGERGERGEMGERGEVGMPGACGIQEVFLEGEDFYPEGIARAADGTLYVGSFVSGEIVRSGPCDGYASPFARVSRAAVGLLLDDSTELLFACDTDVARAAASDVVVFSTVDGSEIARHPFPNGGFCNDLAQDSNGNLYATDSAGGRILRVSAAALRISADAEVVVAAPELGPQPGGLGFGINGIATAADGSLYTVTVDGGKLYRVVLETPVRVEAIPLNRPLASGDGLKLFDDETLFVVEIFSAAVSRIDLSTQTASVTPVVTRVEGPSTLVLDDQGAWIVEGQLDHLFGFDDSPPTLPFRVVWMPVAR